MMNELWTMTLTVAMAWKGICGERASDAAKQRRVNEELGVFADWLEERGYTAASEFIRLELAGVQSEQTVVCWRAARDFWVTVFQQQKPDSIVERLIMIKGFPASVQGITFYGGRLRRFDDCVVSEK